MPEKETVYGMLSVSDKMKPPTSYLLPPTSYLDLIWYYFLF